MISHRYQRFYTAISALVILVVGIFLVDYSFDNRRPYGDKGSFTTQEKRKIR